MKKKDNKLTLDVFLKRMEISERKGSILGLISVGISAIAVGIALEKPLVLLSIIYGIIIIIVGSISLTQAIVSKNFYAELKRISEAKMDIITDFLAGIIDDRK